LIEEGRGQKKEKQAQISLRVEEEEESVESPSTTIKREMSGRSFLS
jgi:hypothetical protein